MADKTFDAVIVGGGNKALLLALYLIKYGGMSVGVFERRHEIGGCLATEELSAPGFRGNTHANIILPWYYAPVWRDFPDFWEYGAQLGPAHLQRRLRLQGQGELPRHLQRQARSDPGAHRPARSPASRRRTPIPGSGSGRSQRVTSCYG